MSWSRYFHTLRHLRWSQIYFLLVRGVPKARPSVAMNWQLRPTRGEWVRPAERPAKMPAGNRVRFLNAERELAFPHIWQDESCSLLWLYNLHYFEDLCAEHAAARRAWHRQLLAQWIRDNPPFEGVGWAPYPTSLRIGNWAKAHWGGLELTGDALDSLALQARWLRQNLEKHLLANHLFANAKALLLAGCLFQGKEAQDWFETGVDLLGRELHEQVLPDGGHFERSAMYHQQILEDLLDVANVLRFYGTTVAMPVEQTIERMRLWLRDLCHPDGQICLFNDAAFGVAPSPGDLEAYALRLGFAKLPTSDASVRHLRDTGYVRLNRGDAAAFVDVAPISPAYQPAHAHADTLTFELSLAGRRIVVDSGTSVYADCAERHRQRGTGAHNTITIDTENSSEIWRSFRVARRARVKDVIVDHENTRVLATHDGYRRLGGRPEHRREWHLTREGLSITDTVSGRGRHRLDLRFHLHPDVKVISTEGNVFRLLIEDTRRELQLTGPADLHWRTSATTYHPEFGKSIPNACLTGSVEATLPWQASTHIVWS